ncbi:MAG: undecaprenyl/decaprenyl-phosphate alpha-N-acetylglucosaminyl 1-phosphate transferase [Bacteroidia bacterium]|nr:undecaprenyl/decaprenyl-phosphate alpha-N-acetylglucosaminyl 1-phosphate transferase [Bacteroidia bacterium]
MLEQLDILFDPHNNSKLWLIGVFALALIIAWRIYPTIIAIAFSKNLMDEPSNRSLHTQRTPTFGGVGIFISMVVVLTLVGGVLDTKLLLLLMGGMTILFFLGLKDDLMVLAPSKKFGGQLICAFLLTIITDIRIVSFSSILDINELPYWVSVGFTLFVYILIINAYNLIDGVDGLAGSIALSISIVLTFLFVKADEMTGATIAVALAGSLIGFLRYNFSKRKKLFMGDTGSMVVGFVLAFFIVSFISKAQTNVLTEYYRSAPALALALCFYPLMDTFRIFFIRIVVHKKSPFKADRNHVHHRFIALGYGHKGTTIIIVGLNLIIIALAFNLLFLNLNTQILLLITYGTLLYGVPAVVARLVSRATIRKVFNATDK